MKTLEMVAKIKEKQKAKAMLHGVEVIVQKKLGSIILIKNGDSEKNIGDAIGFTSTVLDMDWVLQDTEISFTKVFDYIKSGKKVKCVYEDMHGKTQSDFYDDLFDTMYVSEAFNGKWYLVNE